MRIGACLVVLVACANANPDQGALSIDPSSVMLYVGQSATLQAASELESVGGTSWESQDSSIADVTGGSDGAAAVTGVSGGGTRGPGGLGTVPRSRRGRL